jgi:hypothetical protein
MLDLRIRNPQSEIRNRGGNAAREHHHGVHRVQEPELLLDEEPAQASGARGMEKVLPSVQ